MNRNHLLLTVIILLLSSCQSPPPDYLHLKKLHGKWTGHTLTTSDTLRTLRQFTCRELSGMLSIHMNRSIIRSETDTFQARTQYMFVEDEMVILNGVEFLSDTLRKLDSTSYAWSFFLNTAEVSPIDRKELKTEKYLMVFNDTTLLIKTDIQTELLTKQ